VKGRFIFASAALALSVAAAAAPHAKKAAPAKSADTAAQQLIRNCNAHKFETVVHAVVDGQPQQSKVTLCGKEGQTDADWIVTLKDAVAKVTANKQMDPAVRDQIVVALNAEIDRIQNPPALLPRKSAGTKSVLDTLSPLPPITQKPAEGSALPTLQQMQGTQAASLPPPRRTAPTASADQYASLPPLPAAPTAPTQVLAAGTAGFGPLLSRPRMSFSCYTPGEAPEGPCTGFTRDTLVIVHAGEDLPAATSVRFVRDGDPKADVDVAQLKKGRSVRFAVPTDVCRHAVGGRLELKIVRSGQEVGTEGPYNLNC
jgi:hypothetical protein